MKKQTLVALDKLKNDGHIVTAVDFPYLDFLVPTYYVLTTAEASSNLSRFDGVHFGYRSPNATDLESTYKKSRSEGFGKEVKRRIMLGTFVLSAGYYDAYYNKALKVRGLIRQDYEKVLEVTGRESSTLARLKRPLEQDRIGIWRHVLSKEDIEAMRSAIRTAGHEDLLSTIETQTLELGC